MAVDYFQPESFQQANPLLSGLQSGQQIFAQGMQNAYLPQTLQAQLALLRAQGGLTQAQAQFFPLTAQGQYYGGLGRYLQGMGANSPVAVIASLQNNPGYQSLVGNNPALKKQIADIEVQGSLLGRGATFPGIPGMALNGGVQIPPGAPMGNSTNVPVGNLPSVQSNGNVPLTPQQQQTLQSVQNSNGSLLQPSDYQNFGDALASDAIKKTQTSQVMNQRQYSQILDPMLSNAQKLMPSVAKYSGLKGFGELKYDQTKSALGYNSPDYTNYVKFINVLGPNISNELRRVLGGQATDAEKETMDKLVDPTYWHSNPQLAITQYQGLVDLYKNIVNPAISQSPAQVQRNLQQSNAASAPNLISQVTRGMTPKVSKTLNGKTYTKINGQWYQQ